MELKYAKIRQQNRDITLMLIIPTVILAKIIYIFLLPSRYYFDSWRMLSMMNGGGMTAWVGYQNTVDFYTKINIFHLTTLSQWSIVMGLVMTPIMMYLISKTEQMEVRECVFTLMATGVLNIYVFSITKEMIQILYFLCIYIIISLPIKNVPLKILMCAGVYYWESTSFRSYYIIMAAMTVFMYAIFLWIKKRRIITKKHIFIFVVTCFFAVFILFYVSQFVSYGDYKDALNVRDGTTSTIEGAQSAIVNPIEVNGNLGIFMFDYVINAFRMMIPIELLIKSPMYAPFVIYQFFILYYFFKTVKNIKQLDSNMLVTISCFAAYFFGSVVFEPDFGSWVRHEAATFPILQLMAYKSNLYEGTDKRERMVKYEAANV